MELENSSEVPLEGQDKDDGFGFARVGRGCLCCGVSGGELARAQGLISAWMVPGAGGSTPTLNGAVRGEQGGG